ncbi:dynamin family protein [Streptomyces sp. MMS21 TC-5]|uniref:hypothetical protein n=1 Tax=Streptomyces TaxID=1883 RepID=UPI0004C9DE68|nr:MULTISPECIES: hypothetical protein [Streptomyces]MCI4084864.1 dynamin family protein [Streptomyces sp. MMS21 TC-5]
MTSTTNNLSLSDLRLFAQQTLTMLSEQDVPDTLEAHASRDRVQTLAGELASRLDAPVTIGVVGEYSVGKSLLLGTLLGKPDLLPVEAAPSTGNITVLELTRGAPGSATAVSSTTDITFLDEERLAACVGAILGELVATLDAKHPKLGAREMLGGYNPVTDPRGWAPFEAWYPRLWPSGTGPVAHETISAAHRDAVTELCRIRDAALSQQDLLGKPIGVATDSIRAALVLEAARRTPQTPPKRTVQPFDMAQLKQDRTAPDALRRAFPLIERVTQRVTLSPDHWDIGGLTAEEHTVRLLDFPGIGAAGSYGRDTFLSRRELVNVHTILLVLSASRAESEGASAFWDMLTEDGRQPQALASAALVAANAFDLAKPPALSQYPHGPLPLEKLLPHAAEINGVHVYGNKFVAQREDGIVVVSSVSAIRAHQLPYTATSPETRDRIRAALRDLDPPGTRRWEPIAARLAAADPANAWTPRLRAYDEDGGITRLRTLIENHVRRHGLAQKLERAQSSHRKLSRELSVLRGHVRRAGGGGRSEEYRELSQKLTEFRRLLDRMLPALHALRDGGPPGEPDGGPGEEPGGRPPRRGETAEAVRDEVFDWREWQELLGRAERDRHHLVPRSEPPSSEGIPLRRRPGRAAAPAGTAVSGAAAGGAGAAGGDGASADSSETFLDKFRSLIDRRTDEGRDQLRTWFENWAAYWREEFAPLRAWMAEEATEAALSELFTRLRGSARKADHQLDHLWTALDPVTATERIAELLSAPGPTPGDQEARFPARSPHALPWHHRMPLLDPQSEERERHPLLVVQLRQHTADAAARLVTEYLGRTLTLIEKDLVDLYTKAGEYLPAETEVRPPRPSFPPAGAPHDGGDEAAEPDQPIDVLIRAWSTD